MAVTADRVVVELEAKLDRYEANVQRAEARFNSAAASIQQNAKAIERQVQRSSDAVGSQFGRLAGTLAAAFSIREVQQLADTYTRFTNSLKVTGLEGQNLQKVQEQLFGIAQRYGSALETVGQLYGRLTQSSKELGASQSDIMQATLAAAAAIRVQGASTGEAQGALLQLSQMLGDVNVRAQEFNSVNQGARPILLAVANGIERFHGSIAKLRAEVNDSKLTSREFFQGFLKGSGQLEQQAAKANLTIAASFQVLENALARYIGQNDQSFSATQQISGAIQALAKNLDTVAEAVGVLAALFAGRYIAGVIAAVGATRTFQAALFAVEAQAVGAATTMEALGFAGTAAGEAMLGAFGGPVGLAVTALVAGIGYLAISSAQEEAASRTLARSIEQQGEQFGTLANHVRAADAETNNLDATQRKALQGVASLTGQAGLLADAWARVAAAAKQAALEQANAAVVTARTNLQNAKTEVTNQTAHSYARAYTGTFGGVGALPGGGGATAAMVAAAQGRAAVDPKVAAAQQQVTQANLNLLAAQKAFADEQRRPLQAYRAGPGGAPVNAENAKALAKHQQELADLQLLRRGARGADAKQIDTKIAHEQKVIGFLQKGVSEDAATAAAGGGAGRNTAAAAHRAAEKRIKADERYADETEDAAVQIAQAKADATGTAEDRRAAELASIQYEHDATARKITNDENLTAVEKQRLRALNDSVEAARKGAIAAEKEADDRDQMNALLSANIDNQRSELESQQALAKTATERRAIALRLLDLQYQQERKAQQDIADDARRSPGERQQARDKIASLGRQYGTDRQGVVRANQTPFESYLDNLNKSPDQINEMAEQWVVDELNGVQKSISDGILSRLGIKDPILSGILNLFIEQNIMRPIAEAFNTSGSGGGGLFGSLARGAVNLFGGFRASGGHVQAGRLYGVNEHGVEGFQPAGSGKIIPLGRMRSAQGGGVVFAPTINVDASGSVNPQGYAAHIVGAVRRETAAMVAAGMKHVGKGIPARMAQYETDGQ
jgi:tape measure domain-containing protein